MKNFIWDHKRWVPLCIYSASVLVLWFKRTTLIYPHLPALFTMLLYDLVFLSLAFSVFSCIFQETLCPIWVKMRVDRAFKQAGLKNALGQHPTLVSITKDLSKKHGSRYTVRNVGVTIDSMEQKRDSLQREIGIIYEISDSPKPRYTYLYVVPGKSSLLTHAPIVYDHDF